MLLLDKGYYDYDYEKTDKPVVQKDWAETRKSDEEVRNLMAGFGIGVPRQQEPKTLEEIQNYIRKEENYGS